MRSLSVNLLMLTCPLLAQGAPPIPDYTFRLKNGKTLELVPPAAHHFNTSAPTRLRLAGKELKAKVEEPRITATLPAAAQGTVEAVAFLCDDAKTYCVRKPQSFTLPASSPSQSESAPPKPGKPDPALPAKKLSDEKRGLDPATGFILNDPAKAFGIAKKKDLPIMINFFGIWCPPCNHLEEMVLKNPRFQEKTANSFVRLKLDGDREESFPYRRKYNIQGVPTLLFATSTGDEILRVVGYRNLDDVLRHAILAFDSRAEGYAKLSVRASAGERAARLLAAPIALNQGDAAVAAAWLRPLKADLSKEKSPSLEVLFRAELDLAEDAGDHSKRIATLEEWLSAIPASPESITRYSELAELLDAPDTKARRQAILAAGVAAGEALLQKSDPELSKLGELSRADLQATLGELFQLLGDSAKSSAAYLSCAEESFRQGLAENTAFPRGPSLERAYCLSKAGKLDEAEAIYREGVKRFPDEYTYHQQLARFLLNVRGKPAQAASAARSAVRNAYGNQLLSATLLEAKALEADGKPTEAVKALDRELGKAAPTGATRGTLRLREQLAAKREELRKKRN
ncbi:MAG: thioredoxin family protein [Oligoflexia bacterium]|nr:thioredoxin family protein [Oligoflexia bacterium]